MSERFWRTSRRKILYQQKTLIMGILNVTPDSFSDGSRFFSFNDAISRAEQMIKEGADILDIGGESTRPGSTRVEESEEINRTCGVIKEISSRFDIPISIDTTKFAVAKAAIEAGAEIINDISGLKFDENLARLAAETNCGLVLMHLRGTFESMHSQEPVAKILPEVIDSLTASIETAERVGVGRAQIALDVGIGFSKTFEQNLELIAQLEKVIDQFGDFPLLVGTSRKSFVGKILGGASAQERLNGTLASVAIAIFNRANVVRVHDVAAAAEAARVAEAILKYKN